MIPDPLIGQVIADRYQILELLGEGGMGRVYMAEHVRMGRRSAVKVMSPNLALAADAISRFNREAANASRINHPNVAQIYDFGETADGVLYLAMEFIEGTTLSALIEREGPLPLERAAQIVKQVADALGAAHHMGIVHRDLKPDNIMIARHMDGTDWVKVVDFGIAKTVQGSGEGTGSQTVTTAGVSLGTPEYMSPEQLAGERLDNRTDIYSLGLVCFNMLTSDLPYSRVTSKETLVRRLTTNPRTLADVRPDRQWPPALQAALDRALAPEQVDRYAAAADFGRDVVAAASLADDEVKTVRLSAVTVPEAGVHGPNPGQTRRIEEGHQAPSPRRRVAPLVFGAAAVAGLTAAIAYSLLRDRTTSSPAPVAPSVVAAAPDTSPSIVVTPPPAPPPPAPTTRAVVDSPARRLATTASDSAAARTPATPQLSGAPDAGVLARGFRHSFLRANGDSGRFVELPSNVPDEQRIAILRQDIQAHLSRMNNYLMQSDLTRARGEIREVAPVLRMLNQLYPAAPQTRQVDGFLRMAMTKAQAACRTIIADSAAKAPPNFRCDQAFDPRPPGARGRATARPPFSFD